MIISVKKDRVGHIRALHEAIFQSLDSMQLVKLILYVEHTVNPDDLPVALWRFCNNLDPKRDNMLIHRASSTDNGKTFACLGLDGTRKTRELDNFQRDWPNIIVASDDTITAIDKKWNTLGISDFIPSPSLKFKGQMYGEEAVVGFGV